ncbi:AAA family ATPase [Spongiactinospora sp. TRM90649]|uniref:AAA family ATPase n=1 Tax=Spongiactinospora sp. TRM90649 TaxID=3031114 RepID=UPI003211AC24
MNAVTACARMPGTIASSASPASFRSTAEPVSTRSTPQIWAATSRGLVHRPPLLFLDEPTTGLDPQSRAELWDHIRRLREEQGMTVFLSTHYLDEADALCDRLLVIHRGGILAEGTSAELKDRVSRDPGAPPPTLDAAFLAITGTAIDAEG